MRVTKEIAWHFWAKQLALTVLGLVAMFLPLLLVIFLLLYLKWFLGAAAIVATVASACGLGNLIWEEFW